MWYKIINNNIPMQWNPFLASTTVLLFGEDNIIPDVAIKDD
jgi:hypothetical protein